MERAQLAKAVMMTWRCSCATPHWRGVPGQDAILALPY